MRSTMMASTTAIRKPAASPGPATLPTASRRLTKHIERFNNTLGQQVSRLVRTTLAFSKKLENHIGAIRYFICHHNLMRTAVLHLQYYNTFAI